MIQNWGESGIKKDGEEKCFLFTDLSNDPLEILIAKENKVIVKDVNVRKKHVKARKANEESGIIAIESAIPSSKVNVVCSKCGKATRVGYSVEKDQKVRVCKKCGAKIK